MHQISCGSAVEPTPIQLIMREVNLRIFEFGSEHRLENELFSYFCECGNPDCDRKISLHLHRFDPTMPAGSLVAHVPDGEREPST